MIKRTLEQRIARLEKLLHCENKSCKCSKFFESREARDIDGNVIMQTNMVVDADHEEWKVIKVAPLNIMLNHYGFFDNREEVSDYIDENSLYDRNLMQRMVVMLRSNNGDQVLCLEPDTLEVIK